MNTSRLILPCLVAACAQLLGGCSTVPVRALGEATAANATLVSKQITRMETSRQDLVRFQEQLLASRVNQTARKVANLELKLLVWKSAGEGGLVEDFGNYQRISDARYAAPGKEAEGAIARHKRLAEKLPAASDNAAQLVELGKLLAALTPAESGPGALQRLGDFWSATSKLINEEIKKADAAKAKIPQVPPTPES